MFVLNRLCFRSTPTGSEIGSGQGILKPVEQLSFEEFSDLWTEVESAADVTPEIDPWCSGPDWLVPVATGFAPTANRLILATEDRSGFALLAQYSDGGPVLLGGLEPLWGFGTPILGPDPAHIAGALVPILAERHDWHILMLTGMPTVIEEAESQNGSEGPPLKLPPRNGISMAIAMALSPLGSVHFGTGITRQVADLSNGYDGWLARRSPRFRRNLRLATAKADEAGIVMEDGSNDPDLFERLMAVEHRTWKGIEGSGITSVQMSTTYRLMIDRLRERGRLLAHLARHDGQDVGYILGGLRAGRYRGLQLSYDESVRHLSIGNVLQDLQLRQLDDGQLATTYDLGMDFGYKRRWADRAQTSLNLIVRRHQ